MIHINFFILYFFNRVWTSLLCSQCRHLTYWCHQQLPSGPIQHRNSHSDIICNEWYHMYCRSWIWKILWINKKIVVSILICPATWDTSDTASRNDAWSLRQKNTAEISHFGANWQVVFCFWEFKWHFKISTRCKSLNVSTYIYWIPIKYCSKETSLKTNKTAKLTIWSTYPFAGM